MLEQHHHVAHAWRNHYERLHLHTHRGASGLPGLAMPRRYPRYPSRAQVVEYLEAYRARFDLQPEYGQYVESITREAGRWSVRSGHKTWRPSAVVIATGYTRVPHRPQWPGQTEFGGDIVHSCAYSSGRAFVGRRVLVVGLGNSGAEIAIDLVEQGAYRRSR